MKFTRLAIASAPLFLASCGQQTECENKKCGASEVLSPRFADLKKSNSNYTSANELLRALGGEAFTVVLPEDLSETFYAGLVVQHADGKVEQSGRMNFRKDGQKELRVLLFKNQKQGGYDYSILTKSGAMKSSLELPEYLVSSAAPQGRTVKPGDGLIRFGKKEVSSGGPLKFEGNFEIALQITPAE